MEPLSVGLGLAAHLGGALFHAAVHIAGHETFHTLKHKFSHRWLRNHDVSRSLNESYIAALAILERDFKKKETDPSQLELGARALDRLRSQAGRLFPAVEGEAALTEAQAVDLLKDPSILGSTVNELIASARPVPPTLRALLENSFPDAMSFAFKELGLKQNEKVRAVLQHEMLSSLKESAACAEKQLEEVRKNLSEITSLLENQESMRQFQSRFQESIAGSLKDLSTNVSRIASGQDELKVMLQKALDGDGPTHAYLMISDGSGNALTRHPLKATVSTIGRDPENSVQLSHGAVSSRHAEIKSEGGFFIVRDLGSRNGTFLGSDANRIRSKMIVFGQQIRIGPFLLELQSPEQGRNLLEPPGTIPV